MCQLASRLFFTLEHKGSRYELYRDADMERPVRQEGLTPLTIQKARVRCLASERALYDME